MQEWGNIKAVLFDMDGVLVDVSGSYRQVIEETVQHFTDRKIHANTVQRYKNNGGFNDDWTLTHAIITDSGINVSLARVINEFQRRYRGDSWNGLITREEPMVRTRTLETLARTGAVMGIVTGRPEAEAQWTLKSFDWKRYFPLLVAREKHEGRGKPDPFPLQQALGALNAAGMSIRPEDAVYVGDSVDDMKAARAAGMWAVGMVPGFVEREEHAQLLKERGAHLITWDMNTLPDLLKKLDGQPD